MDQAAKKVFPQAMAFRHQDGLVASWQQAAKFAGEGGRLATMPDIVAARLATKLGGGSPWESGYTTMTSEYFGFLRSGKLALIVAHGIGPMSTLEGIKKAYSWEYKDKDRNRRGGRITQQEFWDLEAGKFGPIKVVDIEAYCKRYQYPFINNTLRVATAVIDPLLKARLGPQYVQYIKAHADAARKWHLEQAAIDPENKYNFPKIDHQKFLDRRRAQHLKDGAEVCSPYVISVGDASNCCYYFGAKYGFRKIEPGYAIAHLISTSGLCNLHHKGHESLVLGVHCHEWSNGAKFVGVRAGGNLDSGIHGGPDPYELLEKYWRDLFVPAQGSGDVGFRALERIGGRWFTQYPKVGESMDTGEPEYLVGSAEKIGGSVPFRTTIGGYHGFLRYGINEMRAIAPAEANAYCLIGEVKTEYTKGDPSHHLVKVQFYRIRVDSTRRLIRVDQLGRDYEKMMSLITKES